MKFPAALVVALTAVCLGGTVSAQLRRSPGDLDALAMRQTIVLSPRTLTVTTGGSEQFSATTIGDAEVEWTATGGSISITGLYTAGSTPGAFTITARTPGAAATVPVIVVAGTASTQGAARLVPIHPGESIQAAVNAHPAGASFLIKRGVHRRQSVRPKDGMSFVGEAGAILDGENVTSQAFVGHLTRNVTIRGLRVTRYAPVNLNAAVDAVETQGWVIEGNEIDHNSNGSARAYGVRLGSRGVVRGNSIHHNGWLGINCYNEVETLVEGNELYANPPAVFNDTIGEAANMKLYDCGQITIRGNYVHDSPFRGIWVDTCRPGMTIESNRVTNHGAQGIWYEVSYRGTIRNNHVENAGYASRSGRDWPTDAGIHISNSPDVTVTGNTVVNSVNGIIGHQAASYTDGAYGKNELRNLLVQGNTIVMPRGQSGIAENTGGTAVFVSWNNRFIGNRYVLAFNPNPFFWMGLPIDERQWQAYGQGANDAYSR
jgi:parallel beta-helix repeat protein